MSDTPEYLDIPWFLRQDPQRARKEMAEEKARNLSAEVRTISDQDDEHESYLVLTIEEKSMPYIHIPDTMPDEVLQAMLLKLNA